MRRVRSTRRKNLRRCVPQHQRSDGDRIKENFYRPVHLPTMSTMSATSIIVSTYNHPEWLEKTLYGYACQEGADFELVIADDGSGAATRECIERLRPQLPFPVRHVAPPLRT